MLVYFYYVLMIISNSIISLILAFLSVAVLATLILLCSTISAKIDNVKVSLENKHRNGQVYIYLKLFNFVPYFRYKVDVGNKIKIYSHKNINYNKKQLLIIKNVLEKIKIKTLDLECNIGIFNINITTFIVAIINIIFPIIIRNNIKKYKKEHYHYKINSIYNEENTLNISLNCIFSINLVHIIPVIYKLKKGEKKNDRTTSNRRAYDNRYEQYSRYG